MAGVSKESFFSNIRDALADRGEPIELPDNLEIARVIGPDQDRVEVFAQRVDESGMHAHQVVDEAAMVDKVVELVEAAGAKSAVVPAEDLPAREKIIARLQDRGIELLSPDDPDVSFDADIGITGVHSAIAESASMCVTSGGKHRRLASLAPPRHIGIVRTESTVSDLIDWTANIPADMPANLSLISGPSKTADIEMTLVAGVHGPGEVHVIIVG